MTETELAYVALGANVGAARASLERAVAALAALPGASLDGVSPLYRTRPVGPVAQADFLNAVVGLHVGSRGEPERSALELLGDLKRIEQELGRQERERWGPREVDLDLVLFGDHAIRAVRTHRTRSDDPARSGEQWLEVPHPEASRRLFVLAPLAELAPDVRPPGWKDTVRQARDRSLSLEGEGAVRVLARWDPVSRRWSDAA
jgi:2-amino-4-hydroxy-6-hydroxymethyldihydropteridine diphosphokinase